MKSLKPIICINQGDPSGIGSEIILKAISKPGIKRLAEFLLVGDESIFRRAGRAVKGPNVKILDMANVPCRKFAYGNIRAAYGRAAMENVSKATGLIAAGRADALVTAPISKEAVKKAGFKFDGHTEFLAALTGTKRFAMMLVGGPLRVTLATRHLPVSRISGSLTKETVLDAIELTYEALRKQFGIKKPRIGVCGLNPHAGDGGILGMEEKTVISPAVKKARTTIPLVTGPHAAEAIFYSAYRGELDAAICMYHDQGLVPLKMIARDTGVNITLGLPFVRTSPDHGTAFDLAGKGIANSGSMEQAVRLAVHLTKIAYHADKTKN